MVYFQHHVHVILRICDATNYGPIISDRKPVHVVGYDEHGQKVTKGQVKGANLGNLDVKINHQRVNPYQNKIISDVSSLTDKKDHVLTIGLRKVFIREDYQKYGNAKNKNIESFQRNQNIKTPSMTFSDYDDSDFNDKIIVNYLNKRYKPAPAQVSSDNLDFNENEVTIEHEYSSNKKENEYRFLQEELADLETNVITDGGKQRDTFELLLTTDPLDEEHHEESNEKDSIIKTEFDKNENHLNAESNLEINNIRGPEMDDPIKSEDNQFDILEAENIVEADYEEKQLEASHHINLKADKPIKDFEEENFSMENHHNSDSTKEYDSPIIEEVVTTIPEDENILDLIQAVDISAFSTPKSKLNLPTSSSDTDIGYILNVLESVTNVSDAYKSRKKAQNNTH